MILKFKTKKSSAIEIYKTNGRVIDICTLQDNLIVAYTRTVTINSDSILCYNDIYKITMKGVLLFIMYKNTQICIMNTVDYSILHLYEGIDDYVVDIYTNESYIYILCTNNTLYKTPYTNPHYTVVCTDVSVFAVTSLNAVVYIDIHGKLIVDNAVVQNLLFDVADIILTCNNQEEIFVRTKNNEKLTCESYEISYKEMPDFCVIMIHGKPDSRLRRIDKFVYDGMYIYDLKNRNKYVIKDGIFLAYMDDTIYYADSNFVYRMRLQ